MDKRVPTPDEVRAILLLYHNGTSVSLSSPVRTDGVLNDDRTIEDTVKDESANDAELTIERRETVGKIISNLPYFKEKVLICLMFGIIPTHNALKDVAQFFKKQNIDYCHQCTDPELASIMSISERRLYSLKRQAFRDLRLQLQKNGIDEAF